MSPILQSLANGSARGYGAFFGAAAAPAFESIASASGTGSSGTITFSSIPSTYQHLQIRGIAKGTGTGSFVNDVQIQFNSDTGNNYAHHYLSGNGSTTTAYGAASQNSVWASKGEANNSAEFTNIVGVFILDIQDYASTTKNKTIRVFAGTDTNRTTAPVGELALSSGLWMNTNAINSITLKDGSGLNFTTTTQFALYGIKGA